MLGFAYWVQAGLSLGEYQGQHIHKYDAPLPSLLTMATTQTGKGRPQGLTPRVSEDWAVIQGSI